MRPSFRDEPIFTATLNNPNSGELLANDFDMTTDEIVVVEHVLRFIQYSSRDPENHYKEKCLKSLAEIKRIVTKFKKTLPPIITAHLKQAIVRLDPSKHLIGESAVKSYIEALAVPEKDEDPDQYIYRSLKHIDWSLRFAISRNKESLEGHLCDAINKSLGNNSLSDRVIFSLALICIEHRITEQCSNFNNTIKRTIEIEIPFEDDLFYLNELYPILLNKQFIDCTDITNRILNLAERLSKENKFRAAQTYERLNKFEPNCTQISHGEITQRIHQLRKEAKNDMTCIGQFGIEIEIEPPNLENYDIEAILALLLNQDRLHHSLLDTSPDLLLGQIATMSNYDTHGNQRATNTASANVTLFNCFSVEQALFSRFANICSILKAAKKSEKLSRASLLNYYSKFIPITVAKSLADGVYFLVQEEFHIALPLLMSRFERTMVDSLKHEKLDVYTTSQQDGSQQIRGLDALVTMALENSIIDEQDKMEIECLLTDKSGNMVRHEVLHGVIDDADMTSAEFVNAAWLVIYLAEKLYRQAN